MKRLNFADAKGEQALLFLIYYRLYSLSLVLNLKVYAKLSLRLFFFFKWEELYIREKPQAKFCLFNQNDSD